IAVPGLRAPGFMIHFLRSSGPLLGTAPAAMRLRDATPARFGPIAPFAPGMPGIVWQAPQPFCGISAAPSAGLAPAGAGVGAGLAGTGGAPAAVGAGAAAGAVAEGVAGTGGAAGAGATAAGAPGPACCCCNHCWNSPCETASTRNNTPLWPAPHNSAHTPRYSPALVALKVMRLTRPGFASILPYRSGTQKLWITSAEVTSNTSGVPTGMCRSLLLTPELPYANSHWNCRPVTLMCSVFGSVGI